MIPTRTRASLRPDIRAHMTSDACQHCGAKMLYEDYDPHKSHHGATCLMCSREQVLKNGAKSLLDPNRPVGKGRGNGQRQSNPRAFWYN